MVAWFNRSDWSEIKLLCPPDDLQDTYDQWLANVHAGLHAQAMTEDSIEKIILTPDDLRNWQASNGGEINSKARAEMAVEIGHQRKNTSH